MSPQWNTNAKLGNDHANRIKEYDYVRKMYLSKKWKFPL